MNGKIKKIISGVLISSILLPLSYSYAAKITDEDKFNKLLEKQTKEELQVELKIFKLQKNLVSSFDKSYNDILDQGSKYLDEMAKSQSQDFLMNSHSKIDLNIESTPALNKYVKGIYDENNKNLLTIQSDYSGKFKKHNTDSQFGGKGNLYLDVLGSNINTKFNIDGIIGEEGLYLNLKKLFITEDFNYNSLYGLLYPAVKEKDSFNKMVKEVKTKINELNKIGIKLTGKNIFIEEKVNAYNNDLNNLTNLYNMYINKSKKEALQKMIDLLKTEKIIHIYGKKGKNKYKFVFDNNVIRKINKIAGTTIIKEMSYSKFSEMEKNKYNIIEELNDGSFKYLVLNRDKKTKKINDAMYLVFDENIVSTGLLKQSDNIFFLNKNIIKVRTPEFRGYLSFANNEYKTKFSISDKNTNQSIETSAYIQEGLKGGVIKTKFKDKDTNEIGNFDLMFIKNELNNIKIDFNLNFDLKNNIKKPDLNKNGTIKIDGEYLLKNDSIKSYINIGNTTLLPVNIYGRISNQLDMDYKSVKISKPKNLDYKFKSFQDFYIFLSKK